MVNLYFYPMSELDKKNPAAEKLLRQLRSRWMLNAHFWMRLPTLLFWRVKIKSIDYSQAQVTVPFRRSTQNPFRSIYFAAQAGAAEFSTGILAMLAIEGRSNMSMLVTGLRCEFYKKATGLVTFSCTQGDEVSQVIDNAIQTKEGQKLVLISEGKDLEGDVVTRVWVEWSFKVKN